MNPSSNEGEGEVTTHESFLEKPQNHKLTDSNNRYVIRNRWSLGRGEASDKRQGLLYVAKGFTENEGNDDNTQIFSPVVKKKTSIRIILSIASYEFYWGLHEMNVTNHNSLSTQWIGRNRLYDAVWRFLNHEKRASVLIQMEIWGDLLYKEIVECP